MERGSVSCPAKPMRATEAQVVMNPLAGNGQEKQTGSGGTTVLMDRFGRRVNYLRLSVTDRCDFRCVYCMAEDMTFLPRAEVLTLEELLQVATAFVELGVTKIRLTGGEPLVRRNILWLVQRLGALPTLDELVLTTNGSQLPRLAQPLVDAGVKRINVSLDSLNPERFKRITRTGELSQVLTGEEDGELTAWCWWTVPGTSIEGSGLIKVSDDGVVSERLTYYTALSA